MILKSMGYSFRTDEQDTFDYLTDNMAEIIKDLKTEYGEQIDRGRVYQGFPARQFRIYMTEKMQLRIRELYTISLKFDSEQSLVVKDDPKVQATTNYIIEQVMEET